MFTVDLTNCDREPIHIPGKVQSHGFLIVTDGEGIITHCSDNIDTLLGLSAADLLGRPSQLIDSALGKREHTGCLKQVISIAHSASGFQPSNPYPAVIGEMSWNIVVTESGGHFLFDFEPERSSLSTDLHPRLGRALSEMLGDKQLSRILNNISIQIREIIGYDRVMIYKFHEDDHGEVIAEARGEELESWLGLHYPASDIPRQARELYKVNLVRLIADVSAKPSALVSHSADPLDLTCSGLRAVSPIHIQYLRNMNVASSFSVSIIDNDRLWGLIACHNYTPRFVNYRQRESARLVGQVLSSAISFRQAESDQQTVQQLKDEVSKLTRSLLRDVAVPEALLRGATTLQHVTLATGAAMILENQLYTTGDAPPAEFIRGLAADLSRNMDGDIYVTSRLRTDLPDAAAARASASGILVCRLSEQLDEFLIWFKPEVITTVRWAGDPNKPVDLSYGLATISPRTSFEVWKQEVHNSSNPWQDAEIAAARALRDEINYSISRKAAALRALNEKLREAYVELDAFSYTISHDLKNPVSAIKGFAQLIKIQAFENKEIESMAERIESRALGLTNMIDDVLKYSRLTQDSFVRKPIDMERLLGEIKRDLEAAWPVKGLSIVLERCPDILGDETMITQVFTNLMSNAVKYASKENAPLITVAGTETSTTVIYSVTDNGIGIPPEDHDKIFDLFSRSSGSQHYEGSGVGLAIVKRMLTKHDGKIWLESMPGKGSVFHVQFPKELPGEYL